MTRQNIGKWLTAIRKGSWWADFQPGTSREVEITWNLQPDTRWDPGSRNEGLVLARSQVLVQHGHHVHENRSQVQVSEFNPGSDFMFLVLGQDQGWYDTAATPSKSWIPSLLWPCASSTQSPWNKKRLTPFGHLWHLHLLHRPFGLYRPSLQIHSLTSAFRTFLTWNIKGLWDLLDLFEPFEKCGHVEPFGQITKVVISGMHDCPDVTI